VTAQFHVTFLPDASETWVPEGITLLQAAAVANVAIDAPCGDRGICGKCKVRVLGGLTAPTLPEKTLIPVDELEGGWRLACQTRVYQDMTVQVPERALQPAVVPLSAIAPRPAVRKLHVTMPEPTIEDAVSDLSRLYRELNGRAGSLQFGLPLLRLLPQILERASYDATAVAVGDRLIAVEHGDTTARCFGLAVDLGTTSVVAILADLNTGKVLGVESRLNGQANYGADVISRIHAVMDAGTVEPLQQAAVATINAALESLLRNTGVERDEIYEAVVVGNTCMNHLFLGIDPHSLALAPYQPVVTDPVVTPAADLGVAINSAGSVYTLPNIAGFVGSDTVAVILAAGMHRSDKVKLAIDLGTNGEMVLGNRHRLLACSTAAGPAFEGARISCGMRATEGAIERVWIDGDDVKLQVIGGGAPIGICGSGLLDAVAQMRRAEIVSESGRMVTAAKARADVPDRLAKRLVGGDTSNGFVLGRRGKRQVVLTQGDVRELQLAKGAIRAGISILLKEYGIELSGVSEILLAGAFGSYISPASARAIDLVPFVPIEKITAVGNAAGQGAVMALLSTPLRDEAIEIAKSVRYVELSARPDFMDQFMDALGLGDRT
jgi:uncharacterized 2Fe-2S/4Fe-4S cluster protein (DUF4445 family)